MLEMNGSDLHITQTRRRRSRARAFGALDLPQMTPAETKQVAWRDDRLAEASLRRHLELDFRSV
jgi:hypothetical protein